MDYNKPTLPKEPASKGKKMIIFAAAGGAAVAIAMIILFVIPANTPPYSLSVEPRKKMASTLIRKNLCTLGATFTGHNSFLSFLWCRLDLSSFLNI